MRCRYKNNKLWASISCLPLSLLLYHENATTQKTKINLYDLHLYLCNTKSTSEAVPLLKTLVSKACCLQITASMQTPPVGCLAANWNTHKLPLSLNKHTHTNIIKDIQTHKCGSKQHLCVQRYMVISPSDDKPTNQPHVSPAGACGNGDMKKTKQWKF